MIEDPYGLLQDMDEAEQQAAFADAMMIVEALRSGSSAPADSHEFCHACGSRMARTVDDLEYVCADCGLVVEGDAAEDDDAPRALSGGGQLRIVGQNASQLQPDLYRSGTGATPHSQHKQILEEYKVYRELFIEAGGRAYPINALENAADYYAEVQKQFVKRSQNKKQIMAYCLWRGCLKIGLAPPKAEIADFMQLRNKGIARGDNFVRSLIADGRMEIEANADPCMPEIITLFAHLNYESERYDALRAAVLDVVRTATSNQIGTNSMLRSKVAGAAYAVLTRCESAEHRQLLGRALTLPEFCQDRIRKNTVERFLRQLKEYHSFFVPCYTRAGLKAD